MTSLEKALTDALDQAWVKYDENGSDVAFPDLYRAVKLLAGLAIHREARYLPVGLPQEPPEASAPPLDPVNWESRCKSQQEAMRKAIELIRLGEGTMAVNTLKYAI